MTAHGGTERARTDPGRRLRGRQGPQHRNDQVEHSRFRLPASGRRSGPELWSLLDQGDVGAFGNKWAPIFRRRGRGNTEPLAHGSLLTPTCPEQNQTFVKAASNSIPWSDCPNLLHRATENGPSTSNRTQADGRTVKHRSTLDRGKISGAGWTYRTFPRPWTQAKWSRVRRGSLRSAYGHRSLSCPHGSS